MSNEVLEQFLSGGGAAAVPVPRLTAAKVTRGDWKLRAMCHGWHTVFKQMKHPDLAYGCPYCDADVH